MRELIIGVVTSGVFFYIISLIMEYKAKNFIYEKQNILFILIMMIGINLVGYMYINKQTGSYSMLINVIMIIAVLGGYIIFQKIESINLKE